MYHTSSGSLAPPRDGEGREGAPGGVSRDEAIAAPANGKNDLGMEVGAYAHANRMAAVSSSLLATMRGLKGG